MSQPTLTYRLMQLLENHGGPECRCMVCGCGEAVKDCDRWCAEGRSQCTHAWARELAERMRARKPWNREMPEVLALFGDPEEAPESDPHPSGKDPSHE